MSVDRYDIDISDSIATLGAQRVVDECYYQQRARASTCFATISAC